MQDYHAACRHGRGENQPSAGHWKGWTEIENADAYEALLKHTVLPNLKRLVGYRGGYILRSDGASEVDCAALRGTFEPGDAIGRLASTFTYTVVLAYEEDFAGMNESG